MKAAIRTHRNFGFQPRIVQMVFAVWRFAQVHMPMQDMPVMQAHNCPHSDYIWGDCDHVKSSMCKPCKLCKCLGNAHTLLLLLLLFFQNFLHTNSETKNWTLMPKTVKPVLHTYFCFDSKTNTANNCVHLAQYPKLPCVLSTWKALPVKMLLKLLGIAW